MSKKSKPLIVENTKKYSKESNFWIYPLSMIICFAVFFLPSKTLKILALCGFVTIQLIHLSQGNREFFDITQFILFLAYLIIYSSSVSNELIIGVSTIYLLMLLAMGSIAYFFYKKLRKSEEIPEIIISYLLLSFALISIFTIAYFIFSSLENNNVKVANETVNDLKSLFFFSCEVFYNNTFGETPYGISRAISIIELVFSIVIHVIILGRIINSQR